MLLLATVLFSLSTSCSDLPAQNEKLLSPIEITLENVAKETVYFGAGVAFGSASLLARLGWEISLLSPWSSTVGNECLLLSDLCGKAARYAFTQIFQKNLVEKIPFSQRSWHHNQALLSQIEASTSEEKKLLGFLQNRWLSKSTGFFSSIIEWVYPCFGVFVQIHPVTTHSYARHPSNKLSQTYLNIVEEWKQFLPHPSDFPLLLTRPFDLRDYLPFYLDVPPGEKAQTTVARLQAADSKIIVDLTVALEGDLQSWTAYRDEFSEVCKEHHVDLNRIICIQRVKEGEVGGLRLLPLSSSTKEIEKQNQFLLEWISCFGLTANRIELDRWPTPLKKAGGTKADLEFLSKDDFVSYLTSFENRLASDHPQKTLMVKGTLQVLAGLMAALSQENWNDILKNPTRASVAQISFLKIKKQFELLGAESDQASFFDISSHLELIHADLSSLLEVFTPFGSADFSPIYRDLLTSIPAPLKPLTSCGIHSSGMTSLTGILKAMAKTLDKTPRVLFGENTYFEAVNALQLVTKAASIDQATPEDWREADLILAQFNPVLKRLDLPPTEYKVEKIADTLHRIFASGREKPLTLALDCTLDFIVSPRIKKLLNEFQSEIETGNLNIVCFRSGLKFDLFGMDNYCGAPFYMIHNQDKKWTSFNGLLTDPVLQADRLSLNWFCLAYQNAAPQLDLYRKQIFENTRALLNKVPPRLFKNVDYRIISVQPDAEPAFIDIKVFGPLHKLRAAALVAGCLYMGSMAGGHPIFHRPSLGFYHPNFTMLFTEECSTIRLTLGLDPAQVDLLAGCFKMIDALNGSPDHALQKLCIQN